MKLTFKLIAFIILVAISTARKLRIRREEVNLKGNFYFTVCLLEYGGRVCKNNNKIGSDETTSDLQVEKTDEVLLNHKYIFSHIDKEVENGNKTTSAPNLITSGFYSQEYKTILHLGLACHFQQSHADFQVKNKVYRIKFEPQLPDDVKFTINSKCKYSEYSE